jgi:hypothetical protein
VISPYTQKGTLDSTFYDQDSMVRTMEMILGMKPMSLFDASAVPMLNAFTNHPNFKAYNAEQESYPINWKNGQPEPSVSASQNTQTPTTSNGSQNQAVTAAPHTYLSSPDANQEELSREIWKATKGRTPYPEKAAKGSNKQ